MLTQEQKEFRKSGIGSSDIAAIVGKSPYATPFDVYLSKVEGFEREGTFSTELGDLLEDPVLTLYERRAQPDVLTRHPGTWRHPKHHFVVDTPDAMATWSSDTELRAVEAKTSRFSDTDLWGEEGTDEVPENYLIQATWHLLVARSHHGNRITRCDVPVLIRTDEFRIYRVDWDEELAAILLDEAARFWTDHVEKGVAPDPEGSRTVSDWVKRKYPKDSGQMLKATESDEDLLREYFAAVAVNEETDARVESLKAQLQQRIGDASGLAGGPGQVTWKKAADTVTTNWEALAKTFLEQQDAAARSALMAQFRVTKPGSRRFLKKPAK